MPSAQYGGREEGISILTFDDPTSYIYPRLITEQRIKRFLSFLMITRQKPRVVTKRLMSYHGVLSPLCLAG